MRFSIDFGTSNTVAMLSVPGREPRPLLFDGSPLLPSAVYAAPDGRLVVGRDAWHAGSSSPDGLEPFPKRHIDEQSLLLAGRELPVEAVIAAVLRHVSIEADTVVGEHVGTAVLTYPASWAAPRRGRLAAAAATVFGTVELVAEPVAAARHYLSRVPIPGSGYVLVYDLGAGTFDASAVRCTPDGVELLAATGLDDVGGLDIDAALVAHLGETLATRDPDRWRRLTDPADRSDQRARRQLWDNVRVAKEVLSRTATTVVHVPLFDDEVPLGRERLDALARPMLDRTVAVCRGLSAAVGGSGPLLGVFLVGGASRMPLVQTLLHQALGVAPAGIEQPELAVAEGALAGPPAAVPDANAGLAVVPDADGGPAAGRSVPGQAPTGQTAARQTAAGQAVAGRWDRLSARLPGGLRRWVAAGVAVAVVAAAGLWLTVGDPRRVEHGGRVPAAVAGSGSSGSPSSSPTPSPTPSPLIDPCLIGVWVSTSYSITNYVDSVPTPFRSTGGTVKTIRADGTFVHDYNKGATRTARVGSDRWQQRTIGTISGRIRTADRTIVYSRLTAKGSSWFIQNGQKHRATPLTANPAPVTYLCSGNSLTEYTADYQIEYTRRTSS